MELQLKKAFAIAILAFLIALVAYTLAQAAQTTANLANQTANNGSNFTANITGEAPINRSITFIAGANITLFQYNSNKTIQINASGGGTGAPGAPGTNFTINTTGQPPIANFSTLTGSNGIVITQPGANTINIAAPSDSDPYIPLANEPNLNVNSSVYCTGAACNKVTIRDIFTGDGITLNFTTTNNITSGSSMVYLNGLLEAYQIIYTEYSHSINFTYAPPNSDDIEVDYVKG